MRCRIGRSWLFYKESRMRVVREFSLAWILNINKNIRITLRSNTRTRRQRSDRGNNVVCRGTLTLAASSSTSIWNDSRDSGWGNLWSHYHERNDRIDKGKKKDWKDDCENKRREPEGLELPPSQAAWASCIHEHAPESSENSHLFAL